MPHEEVIISGFGGQGALFAGQLLAYSGIAEALHVTWLPSYGPEMRGGTANCTVILSDEEVGSPYVRQPSAAMILNLPSLEKFGPLVRTGGLLVVNESLVPTRIERTDIRCFYLPASDIATELGNPRMANLVLLGALLQASRVVSLQTAESELAKHLSERQRRWLEPNIEAMRAGFRLAEEESA